MTAARPTREEILEAAAHEHRLARARQLIAEFEARRLADETPQAPPLDTDRSAAE